MYNWIYGRRLGSRGIHLRAPYCRHLWSCSFKDWCSTSKRGNFGSMCLTRIKAARNGETIRSCSSGSVRRIGGVGTWGEAELQRAEQDARFHEGITHIWCQNEILAYNDHGYI